MEFLEMDKGWKRTRIPFLEMDEGGEGTRIPFLEMDEGGEGTRISFLETDEGGKRVSGCKDLRQFYSALYNPRGKGNAYPDRTKQAPKSKRVPLLQHQTTDRKVYNSP